MITYKNQLYDKGLGQKLYTSILEPFEYKGYLIYLRFDHTGHGRLLFDIVKNGECLVSLESPYEARDAIDRLAEKQDTLIDVGA